MGYPFDITIVVEVLQNHHRLAVADTGIDLDAADTELLFSFFGHPSAALALRTSFDPLLRPARPLGEQRKPHRR